MVINITENSWKMWNVFFFENLFSAFLVVALRDCRFKIESWSIDLVLNPKQQSLLRGITIPTYLLAVSYCSGLDSIDLQLCIKFWQWFHRPLPNFDDHEHGYDTTCIIKHYFCGLCGVIGVNLAHIYEHMLQHLQFSPEINVNLDGDIYYLSSTDDSSTDNASGDEK